MSIITKAPVNNSIAIVVGANSKRSIYEKGGAEFEEIGPAVTRNSDDDGKETC